MRQLMPGVLLRRLAMIVLMLALSLCPDAFAGYSEGDITDAFNAIERLGSARLSDEEFKWELMRNASLIISEGKDLQTLENELELLLRNRQAGISNSNSIEVISLLAQVNERIGDYGKAKRYYIYLRYMQGGKDKSYLSALDKKVEAMDSKIRIGRKIDNLDTMNVGSVLYGLAVLAIVIIVFVLFYFWDGRFIEGNKSKFKHLENIPDDRGLVKKPIEIERLAQLDGRVSKDVLDEYVRHGDGNAGDIEAYRYAKLIVNGHKMIRNVNRLAPIPLALVHRIPVLKNFPPLLNYTIVGFVVSAVLAWTLIISGTGLLDAMVIWILLAAFIILCLQGMKIMATATINSLDEIICMMEPPRSDKDKRDPIGNLGGWVRHLFRSPWQFFVIIFFLTIILMKMFYGCKMAGVPITECDPTISLFVSSVVLFFAGPVVWLIFGSVIMLNRLSGMRDLDINPLSPIKTMGLEKWVSVISVYNITCSIILTFGCSITIFMSLFRQENTYDFFWFFLIMPLLAFYWIYPHLKLGALVKSIKSERMQFLKTRISGVFTNWMTFEEDHIGGDLKTRFEYMQGIKPQLDGYYEVFRKIDESPHSYIDIYSALELLKALGIPSVFALATALLL